MSATATETTSQDTSSAPEFTSLHRVASIPLVRSSLDTADNILSTNTYLRDPYSAAKNISASAVKLTEPLQVRFAPLVNQANGYVNKGLDVVQSRFPYPFEAKPEELAEYVRERRQSVTEYATKTLNDNVKTRAINVAQGLDQRFAPIVNYFESAATYLPGPTNGGDPSASASADSESKYQYQRALAISKTIRGNLYVYSSEHLKQLQEHSRLVQSATEAVQSFAGVTNSAQARMSHVSDTMIAELQKLRESSKSLSESLQNQAQNMSLPSRAHEVYADMAEKLSPTINELRSIAYQDAPLAEKVQRMTGEVKDSVAPLLDTIRTRIAELRPRGKEESSAPVAEKVDDESS